MKAGLTEADWGSGIPAAQAGGSDVRQPLLGPRTMVRLPGISDRGVPLRPAIWAASIFLLTPLPGSGLGAEGPPAGTLLSDPAALAERWAPTVYQNVAGSSVEDDFITRFDFDGDWNAWNNQENLASGSFDLPGAVYYSVIETGTHVFLAYAFFHPYDASLFTTQEAAACALHENDMEGVVIAVRKDGLEPGDFRLMATEAHNEVYTFKGEGDSSVVLGTDHLDGQGGGDSTVYFESDGSPAAFVEADGHGVGNVFRAMQSSASGAFTFGGESYDFSGSGGVVYYHDGNPGEVPASVSGVQLVRYDLIPLETLWERRFDRSATGTFCDGPGIDYTGTRGCPLDDLSIAFGGSGSVCLGQNRCLANPPWGWLPDDPDLVQGEWFLDPAYVMGFHHVVAMEGRDDTGFLQYASNPFLQGETYLSVEEPFEATELEAGDSLRVVWTRADTGQGPTLGSFVSIELSRGNGGWEVLAAREDSVSLEAGAFVWVVTGPASDSCRVRVSAGATDCPLTVADASGIFSILETQTSARDGGPGPGIALGPIRPNPFLARTEISFSLEEPDAISLAVYDITGRLVRTLARGPYPAGRTMVFWDGRNDSGRRVSSGVYFSRLDAAGQVRTRRMVFLR
jgi:hypothetical protein